MPAASAAASAVADPSPMAAMPTAGRVPLEATWNPSCVALPALCCGAAAGGEGARWCRAVGCAAAAAAPMGGPPVSSSARALAAPQRPSNGRLPPAPRGPRYSSRRAAGVGGALLAGGRGARPPGWPPAPAELPRGALAPPPPRGAPHLKQRVVRAQHGKTLQLLHRQSPARVPSPPPPMPPRGPPPGAAPPSTKPRGCARGGAAVPPARWLRRCTWRSRSARRSAWADAASRWALRPRGGMPSGRWAEWCPRRS
jgi:hypothetical protein